MDADEQERALRRIRGLLDKAGSTSFGPEADALYDKAAELMARHRIDAALLDASRAPVDRSPVEERPVDLGSGQYVRARLQLIHHIATNHGCRLLTHTTRDGRVATVVGVADDCTRVELLYTSLLLQATRLAGGAWAARSAAPTGGGVAAAAAGAPRNGPVRLPAWRRAGASGRAVRHGAAPEVTPGERRRSVPAGNQVAWKREFLFGFGSRVGERLAELAVLAARAPDDGATSGSVALVLADRSQRVDEWLARAHPRLRSLAPAAGFTGHGGLAAGRTSADQADLGSRPVGPGRRALPR